MMRPNVKLSNGIHLTGMRPTMIQNPNDPDYWDEVKRRAAIRGALALLEAMWDRFLSGLTEEAWPETEALVATFMGFVRGVVSEFGLLDDADLHQAFRVECADWRGWPENFVDVDFEEAVREALGVDESRYDLFT